MSSVADAVGTHPQAAAESNIIDHHEISAAQQQDWHAPMAVPTIARIDDFAAFTEVGKLLDSKAENWFGWSQSMYNLFDLYDVREYVQGEVPCPDPVHDPVGAENWHYNDTYAQILITNNIAATEKVYINGCPSAHKMWHNLQSIYEPPGHHIDLFRKLVTTTITEEDEAEADIFQHLARLKQYWVQLDLFSRQENRHTSEALFNRIIAASLPRSWDRFTNQFLRARVDEVDTDPNKNIHSHQFICIIIREFEFRQSLKAADLTQKNENSLGNRISCTTSSQKRSPHARKYCRICRRYNHNTSKCRFIGKSKCGACGRFGHATDGCRQNTG